MGAVWPPSSEDADRLTRLSEIPAHSNDKIVPTELLRTFVTIHELGSFTKAANLFKLTQPAISAQMRRLESIIGADLIGRRGSGIELTPRGREILTFANRILSLNDQILSSCGYTASARLVRLGVCNAFAGRLLRALMRECADKAGNAKLQICCDHSSGLLHGIRNGYLDIACIVGTDIEHAEILRTWHEDLVWVRSPHLGPRNVGPVPLIGSLDHSVIPDRLAIEALLKANQNYEIVFAASDVVARYTAAVAGFGYLPMSRRLVPETLLVDADSDLPALPSLDAHIVTRQEFDPEELSPLISAFETVLHLAPVSSAEFPLLKIA